MAVLCWRCLNYVAVQAFEINVSRFFAISSFKIASSTEQVLCAAARNMLQ